MKLVMFDIDNQKNLIIQFPVFVQPYTHTKLTLYQVETVTVPILDASNKIQSVYPTENRQTLHSSK